MKKLAGHSRIETTMRYIHMNDARARTTLEKVWAERNSERSAGTSGREGGLYPEKKARQKELKQDER
jgi:hypothetical protein